MARPNVSSPGKGRKAYSKYKGVSWHKGTGSYIAFIKQNGVQTHLGSFDDEVEAAKAYDKAAVERRGETVALNFPVEKS